MYTQNAAFFHESPVTFETGVIGRDTRSLVRNTIPSPFRYVCQLRWGNTLEQSKPIGSGVLIGKQTLLTAAHVVFGPAPDSLLIIPGKNGSSNSAAHNPFGFVRATDKFINDTYTELFWQDKREEAAGFDYALVRLERDISSIGFWGAGITASDNIGSSVFNQPTNKHLPLPANQLSVNLCGYPIDKDGGNRQYLSYNKAVRLDQQRNLLYYQNDVYSGHSGSPVWIRRSADNGGRILIGIHKGSGDMSSKNNRLNNRAVFIGQEMKRFIDANNI